MESVGGSVSSDLGSVRSATHTLDRSFGVSTGSNRLGFRGRVDRARIPMRTSRSSSDRGRPYRRDVDVGPASLTITGTLDQNFGVEVPLPRVPRAGRPRPGESAIRRRRGPGRRARPRVANEDLRWAPGTGFAGTIDAGQGMAGRSRAIGRRDGPRQRTGADGVRPERGRTVVAEPPMEVSTLSTTRSIEAEDRCPTLDLRLTSRPGFL